jgi:hypothetical protein
VRCGLITGAGILWGRREQLLEAAEDIPWLWRMAEAVVAELAVVGVTEAAEVVRVAGAAVEAAGIRAADHLGADRVVPDRAVEVAGEVVEDIIERREPATRED